MPVPQYPDKDQKSKTIVTAWRFAQYLNELGKGLHHPLPWTMLIIYSNTLLDELLTGPKTREWTSVSENVRTFGDPARAALGLAKSGIGAPAAVVLMEELMARGARRFITIGSAGSLEPTFNPGDVVLARFAVRDEGTSHHYAVPGYSVTPDRDLTNGVGEQLPTSFRRTGVWTTDAPYRETLDEARFHRSKGAGVVDMEAAALMTVARVCGARLASVFVVSDRLSLDGDDDAARWEPCFHAPVVKRQLATVARALAESYGRYK